MGSPKRAGCWMEQVEMEKEEGERASTSLPSFLWSRTDLSTSHPAPSISFL